MKSEDVLIRLIRKFGIRRAMVLYGAASLAATQGWDVMIGDDGYSRQAVWNWKRDIGAAGIDPAKIELSGFDRRVSRDVGEGLTLAKENIRRKQAAKDARAVRGRSTA